MHLNALACMFVPVFSVVFLIVTIEFVPHSIHHINEHQRGNPEKSCPFFDLWLQSSSTTIPDFSISVLTGNHVVDCLLKHLLNTPIVLLRG